MDSTLDFNWFTTPKFGDEDQKYTRMSLGKLKDSVIAGDDKAWNETLMRANRTMRDYDDIIEIHEHKLKPYIP